MGDKLLNFLFTNEKLCLRKFKLLDHRSDTNNLQSPRSNPYFLRVLLWFKDASALKIKKSDNNDNILKNTQVLQWFELLNDELIIRIFVTQI